MTLGQHRPQAGWLSTAAGQGFGMYYPARSPAGAPPRAVLLCPSFGSERMVLHLAYRHIAQGCAERGIAALCFDYPGTSDADDYPRDALQWQCWVDSARDAAAWLMRESGAAHLTCFGLGIGATVAYAVCSDRDDADSCVAWAPAISGRAFVREQAALASLHSGGGGETRSSRYQDGDVEGLGFLLTGRSVEQLRSLDMLEMPGAGAARVLVIPRARTSRESRWVDRLRAAGVEVDFDPEPPLNLERDLLDPQRVPPLSLLGQCVDWIAVLPAGRSPAVEGSVRTRRRSPGSERITTMATVRSRDGQDVCERFVRYGPDQNMCAIMSEPLAADGCGRAPLIVLVNGGHNHRPGVNRCYTEWARAWAGRGMRVMRIDLPGLGDAESYPPELVNRLYLPRTRRDLVQTIEFGLDTWGHGSAVLVGLCAGGYEALRCALVEDRVVGVVAMNLLRLFPGVSPGQALADLREADTWRRYRGAPREGLGAAHNLWSQGSRVVAERLGLYGRRGSRFAHHMGGLTDRGTETLLIFDDREPMADMVEGLLRDNTGAPHDGAPSVVRISGSDHIFSPLRSQEQLFEQLDAYVSRVVQRRLGAQQQAPDDV